MLIKTAKIMPQLNAGSLLTSLCPFSVTILKNVGYKFSCKSSPNMWWLFGPFRNNSLSSKNCCGHFWATFGNIGTIFFKHLVTLFPFSVFLKTSCISSWLNWKRKKHGKCCFAFLQNVHFFAKKQYQLCSKAAHKMWSV